MSDNECLMIFLTTPSDNLDNFEDWYKKAWIIGFNMYKNLTFNN